MTDYYDASQIATIDQCQQERQAMNLKRPPRNPGRRSEHECDEARLARLDTVMDSYLHWRDQSRTVQESYRQWKTAGPDERVDAVDRYFMALDREEHAARGYRHVVEQTHA